MMRSSVGDSGMAGDLTVFSAVKPLFIISKILGIGPFTFTEGNESTKLSTSSLALVYSSFILVLIATFFIMDVSYFKDELFGNLNLIFFIPTAISNALSYAAVFVSVLLCIFRTRFHVIDVFQVLEYVDKSLHCARHPVHIKARHICIATACVSYFFTWAVLTLNGISMKHVGIARNVCVNSILITVTLQFVSLVLILKHRLTLLNKLLLNIFGVEELTFRGEPHEHVRTVTTKNTVHPWSAVSEHSERLSEILKVHMALCHLGSLISSAYGIQMLLILTEFLVSSVGFVFGIICALVFVKGNTEQISGTILCFLYVVCVCYQLFLVALSCQSATSEAERTGLLVHQLLVRYPKNNRLQVFSQQLIHVRLELSACKLLPLNNTLLIAFAAAVTTYTVILLQFLTSGAQN